MVKAILNFWNRLLGNTIPEITIQLEERVVTVEEKNQTPVSSLEEIKKDMEELGLFIEGEVTKNKLNRLTKAQIVAEAKTKFDIDLDIKLTKSNLVEKLYTLYHL